MPSKLVPICRTLLIFHPFAQSKGRELESGEPTAVIFTSSPDPLVATRASAGFGELAAFEV
jgi:hypothetical protein